MFCFVSNGSCLFFGGKTTSTWKNGKMSHCSFFLGGALFFFFFHFSCFSFFHVFHFSSFPFFHFFPIFHFFHFHFFLQFSFVFLVYSFFELFFVIFLIFVLFFFSPFYHLFFLLFFSRPSRRQDWHEIVAKFLLYKIKFSCENKCFWPRWTGSEVRNGQFEGDSAVMFFHFSVFLRKMFLFFFYFFQKCFFAGRRIGV